MIMRPSVFCLISSVTWAVLGGGLISCASYTTETAAMREAYIRGNYDLALESLEKSGLKDRSQDRLLWRLEAATILDRKGEFDKSRLLWFEADRIADQLLTLSISKSATSLIVSESSGDYDGEDYEKVAIHAMLAHQYIGLGQLDEARVEARKLNTKLDEINQKYNPDGKYKYKEDAHARYISALIYEARGELDHAIVDYEKARKLYEGEFSGYIQGPLPRGLIKGLYRCLVLRGRQDRVQLIESQYGPKSSVGIDFDRIGELRTNGEVVVVHELGRVAAKYSREEMLTVSDQLVRFSSPQVRPNPITNLGTGILVNQTDFFTAENTVYMDAIAQDSLENSRSRLLAKQMTRLLAKGQINYQAKKQFGPLGGLAANVLTLATETADTRSWTTLPQAFFITRARLSPGQHQIVVRTNGRSSEIKTVQVKRGQISILRAIDG